MYQRFITLIPLKSFHHVLQLSGINIREAYQPDPRKIQKHLLMLMSHEAMANDCYAYIFHTLLHTFQIPIFYSDSCSLRPVVIKLIINDSEFGLLLAQSDGLRHSLDLVCSHAAAEFAGEDNAL